MSYAEELMAYYAAQKKQTEQQEAQAEPQPAGPSDYGQKLVEYYKGRQPAASPQAAAFAAKLTPTASLAPTAGDTRTTAPAPDAALLGMAGLSRTRLSPEDEVRFREWYRNWAEKAGIDQNPDNPLHKYDYRGAYAAGMVPQISAEDGLYHWPSAFKDLDHPNRFVNGIDTRSMDRGTKATAGLQADPDTMLRQRQEQLRQEAVQLPQGSPERQEKERQFGELTQRLTQSEKQPYDLRANVQEAEAAAVRAPYVVARGAMGGVTLGLSDVVLRQIENQLGGKVTAETQAEQVGEAAARLLGGIITGGRIARGVAGRMGGAKGIKQLLALRQLATAAINIPQQAAGVINGDKSIKDALRDAAVGQVSALFGMIPELGIRRGLVNFASQVAGQVAFDAAEEMARTRKWKSQEELNQWMIQEIPNLVSAAVFAGMDLGDKDFDRRRAGIIKDIGNWFRGRAKAEVRPAAIPAAAPAAAPAPAATAPTMGAVMQRLRDMGYSQSDAIQFVNRAAKDQITSPADLMGVLDDLEMSRQGIREQTAAERERTAALAAAARRDPALRAQAIAERGGAPRTPVESPAAPEAAQVPPRTQEAVVEAARPAEQPSVALGRPLNDAESTWIAGEIPEKPVARSIGSAQGRIPIYASIEDATQTHPKALFHGTDGDTASSAIDGQPLVPSRNWKEEGGPSGVLLSTASDAIDRKFGRVTLIIDPDKLPPSKSGAEQANRQGNVWEVKEVPSEAIIGLAIRPNDLKYSELATKPARPAEHPVAAAKEVPSAVPVEKAAQPAPVEAPGRVPAVEGQVRAEGAAEGQAAPEAVAAAAKQYVDSYNAIPKGSKAKRRQERDYLTGKLSSLAPVERAAARVALDQIAAAEAEPEAAPVKKMGKVVEAKPPDAEHRVLTINGKMYARDANGDWRKTSGALVTNKQLLDSLDEIERTTKPAAPETAPAAEQPPAAPKTLVDALNTRQVPQPPAESGATHIRVTDENGREAVVDVVSKPKKFGKATEAGGLTALAESGPFKTAEWGVVNAKGKFVPLAEQGTTNATPIEQLRQAKQAAADELSQALSRLGKKVKSKTGAVGVDPNAPKENPAEIDVVVAAAKWVVAEARLRGLQIKDMVEELVRQFGENVRPYWAMIQDHAVRMTAETATPGRPLGAEFGGGEEKQRRFLGRAQAADTTPRAIIDKLNQIEPQTYEQHRTTAEYNALREWVMSDPKNKAEAESFVYNAESPSATKTAMAAALIERYRADGNERDEVRLVDFMDNQLREGGRFIQAASLMYRASGEAWYIKFSRYAKERGVDIPEADAQSIRQKFKEASRLPEGEQRTEALRDAVNYASTFIPFRAGDWLDAYRYFNMLATPLPHERNAFFNLLAANVARPINLMAQGQFRGAAKYTVQSLKAIPEAWSEAVKAFRDMSMDERIAAEGATEGIFEAARQARGPQNAAGKAAWHTLTSVRRALNAGDKFFSTMIEAGETQRLMSKGVSGEKAKAQAADLAEDLLVRRAFGKDMNDAGVNQVSRAIDYFGKQMMGWSKAKQPFIRWPTKWFIPFIRSPLRYAMQQVEHTPVGFVANVKKMTPEMRARAITGTMAMVAGGLAAYLGKTTGAAPKDRKAKEDFYASGRRPYSVLIGDRWVPMWYFGPWALALAIPAAFRDAWTDNPKLANESWAEKASGASLASMKFLFGQSPMAGAAAMTAWMTGEGVENIGQASAMFASQLVPASGMMRYINKWVDPHYRKAKDLQETMMRDIPGFSKQLDAYKNPEGEPSKRPLSDRIAPFTVGKRDEKSEQSYQDRMLTLRTVQGLNNDVDDMVSLVRRGKAPIEDLVMLVESQPNDIAGKLKTRISSIDKEIGAEVRSMTTELPLKFTTRR